MLSIAQLDDISLDAAAVNEAINARGGAIELNAPLPSADGDFDFQKSCLSPRNV
jgi:hypothetical protein